MGTSELERVYTMSSNTGIVMQLDATKKINDKVNSLSEDKWEEFDNVVSKAFQDLDEYFMELIDH